MRKNFSNMDGVIEQFDAVSSITPVGDRFDYDNFYNATSKIGQAVKKSLDNRQKRKTIEAKAQLAASKGLSKSAESNKELYKALAPTATQSSKSKGLSTGAKIGIGVGVAAVLGIGAYFLLKKK